MEGTETLIGMPRKGMLLLCMQGRRQKTEIVTYQKETTEMQCFLSIMSHSGAQSLSGRVLDLRSRGCRFEPHRWHCVVSFSKTIILCLVLVQPRKIRLDRTEKLLIVR